MGACISTEYLVKGEKLFTKEVEQTRICKMDFLTFYGNTQNVQLEKPLSPPEKLKDITTFSNTELPIEKVLQCIDAPSGYWETAEGKNGISILKLLFTKNALTISVVNLILLAFLEATGSQEIKSKAIYYMSVTGSNVPPESLKSKFADMALMACTTLISRIDENVDTDIALLHKYFESSLNTILDGIFTKDMKPLDVKQVEEILKAHSSFQTAKGIRSLILLDAKKKDKEVKDSSMKAEKKVEKAK